MKIQEFRDKMKRAERPALETVAAELYKRMPKGQKEQFDIELEELLRGVAPSKARAKAEKQPFEELEQAIQTFLDYVDADYYIAPNRVVPAAKRSKWRFEVMRFIKQLDQIPADDPNAEAAARLYLEIYDRLAYGCGVYIFRSDDPFQSIGSRQGDFYPRLAARCFATGFTDAKILDLLRAATSVYIDRYSLYIEFELAFVLELKTRDMREKALEIARREVERLETEVLPKVRRGYGTEDYRVQNSINQICITILGLGIALFEEDDALSFYMKHHGERKKEVKLYIALRTIEAFGGSDAFWRKTYEQAVKKGVQPRKELIEDYQARQG